MTLKGKSFLDALVSKTKDGHHLKMATWQQNPCKERKHSTLDLLSTYLREWTILPGPLSLSVLIHKIKSLFEMEQILL